jgi:putative ABC transport system permease protein
MGGPSANSVYSKLISSMEALRHALFLARAQLGARPLRSLTLTLGLAVALALPSLSALGVSRLGARLSARAEGVPVLVVPRGEAVDGTLAALYFRPGPPLGLRFGQIGLMREAVGDPSLRAAPLHLGHSADGAPIVGTGLAYFEERGLQVAVGRRPALLGEVVVGAALASARGLGPGDRVRSDLRDLYDLSGASPLSLPVVGVLAPTGNADDYAVFTDVKTCWALDGHLHGHAAPTAQPAEGAAPDEGAAATFLIQALDEETRGNFHLHGDEAELLISSVMWFPQDDRARDLLLAAVEAQPGVEAVRPARLVGSLLGVLRQVEVGVRLGLMAVSAAALAFFGVALQLARAARAEERRLLIRLGASRRRLLLFGLVEDGIVVMVAVLVAALLVGLGLAALDRALLG